MKAVFVDYTGTLAKEDCPAVRKMLQRFYEHSDLRDPQEMLAYWWKHLKEYEESSYLDTYITEDQIVKKLLEQCARELNLTADREELQALCRESWAKAPLFEDVQEFFEKCPVPIYIVTNIESKYVQIAMDDNGLRPAGIIYGDMVKAYKPHRELFEKALEVSGCRADEVLHIGDSVASDVEGAQNVGIKAVLLDRRGSIKEDGFPVVGSLPEVWKRKLI